MGIIYNLTHTLQPSPPIILSEGRPRPDTEAGYSLGNLLDGLFSIWSYSV